MHLKRKFLLILLLALLVFLNARLLANLVETKRENRQLSIKLEHLKTENVRTKEMFVLKQDHMRKLLTDRNFIEQMLRQTQPCVKDGEIIVKFEE